MALTLEATRVLLKSDDALWYWLELASDEGRVFLSCDGVADTPPGGADEYAVLDGDDGNTYRLSLTTVVTDFGIAVSSSVVISPAPETSLPRISLTLNGARYDITITVEEGNPVLGVEAYSDVVYTDAVNIWLAVNRGITITSPDRSATFTSGQRGLTWMALPS